MSSGISFSGLSSGLDTNSIVSQLIALERLPIQRLQRQQALLKNQQGAYGQFKTQLQALNSALSSLNNTTSFESIKTTLSSSDYFTASASSTASPGIHDVIVSKLAKAERLSSVAHNDSTSALGYSGTFEVNGETITVTATDTLASIATKVNEADANVTASVINGGTGRTYLTLTSKETGLEGKIDFGDDLAQNSPTGVLAKLGFVGSFKTTITNGFSLPGVVDPDANLSTQFSGLTGTQTIHLDGKEVTFDASTFSLNDLASEITTTTGLTTTVALVSGKYELQISGPATPSVLDDTNFFKTIGALTSPTVLVAAQDAEVEIDGVDITSSTNELKDVLTGITLNLTAADATKTIKLTVEKDNTAVVNNVKGLVTAYNNIHKFIKENSKFDNETFQSGVLFGDSLASQIDSALNQAIFSSVSNLTGDFRNLTQLGMSLDSNGDLKLSEADLQEALNEDAEAVADVFRAIGRSENEDLVYVSSGHKSKASGAGGFAINVTRLATQSTVTAAIAQTAANRGGEILTFKSSGLGSTGYQLALGSGKTLAETVSMINSDSKLKDVVEASIEGGKLKITSKKYGSSSETTVTSNLAAAADTSGIGTSSEAVKVIGLDIAGTINGETAEGNGQFLVGKSGNANTEGLMIQYKGTSTGAVGSMMFTRGVTGALLDSINTFLESESGLLNTSNKSLDTQISDIDDRIKKIDERATAKEKVLRLKFVQMEQAMQAAQAQMSRLQAMSAR